MIKIFLVCQLILKGNKNKKKFVIRLLNYTEIVK